MDQKIIKFNDTEIEKYKFHQYKSPVSIDNIGVNKIVVSNKISFGKNGFKHFIDYNNAEKYRPLWIFFPKMSTYRREFDKTKCVFFFIRNEKLLEKYDEIWKKKSAKLPKKNLTATLYKMKNI